MSNYKDMSNYKEYELDLLGVEGAHKQLISPYRFWYDHVKNNAHKNDGDIYEFGVYKGRTLITAALILKELKSKKKIFGFDSFSGFPPSSKYDDLSMFKKNFFDKRIQKEFQKFIKIKSLSNQKKKFDVDNISSSGNFSKTSIKILKEKIDYFGLDNIEVIKGDFKNTVPYFFKNNAKKISSCNVDCDLYDSYKTILPYLYSNLSKNGYIHLDEYYSLKFPGAKIATDSFCKKMKIRVKKNKVRKGEFDRYYLTK